MIVCLFMNHKVKRVVIRFFIVNIYLSNTPTRSMHIISYVELSLSNEENN